MRPARVLTLVVVLAVCAGCARSPSGAGPDLRVMTWNVLTARFDPPQWAGTIAAWRPAVVGLQEICAGEAVALADLLRREHGLPYVAVPGPIRPTPVEDADPVNAALRRPCHDGAVVQYGLAVLTVYNTHVGLAGVQAAQSRELAGRPVREPGPTVVLGDLNADQERDPGVLAPLREGFAEVDPERRLRTSVNAPDDPDATPLDEIDYAFVRGLMAVEPAAAPWTPSSDHRPLIGALR